MSRILLSMKILREIELLELQAIVHQKQQAKYQPRESTDPEQDYEVTAEVALAGLNVAPLDIESVKQAIPDLNGAELSLVSFALLLYLECRDVSEGTKFSEQRKNGFSGGGGMAPMRGPMRRQDMEIEVHKKVAEAHRTVKREFDAGNKEKALSLLDDFIKLREQADQPVFGLKLHREFMFFHQPGDYAAIISLCEQSLATAVQTGNFFWQFDVLEIMTFAALRMGQKQRAISYLDQIERRLANPSPEDVARMTVYYDFDSDENVLSLFQNKLKSSRQLRSLISA